MIAKLTQPIRRAVEIDGEPYTLVVSPEGIRLTRKRFRHGPSIGWRALLQLLDEREAGADVERG